MLSGMEGSDATPTEPRPSPGAWRDLGLGLALALLTSGCGSEDAGPEPLAVEHLTLSPIATGAQASGDEVESYVRFDLPADRDAIDRVRGGTARPDERADRNIDVPGLFLAGKGVDLQFKGDFKPASFNQAIVTFSVFGKADVAVSLMRGRSVVAKTHDLRYDGGRGESLVMVTLDLPETLREVKPLDRVVVHSTRVLKPPTLHSLELVLRPLSRWLPSSADGPQPVLVAEEQRLAVGLSSDSPLETSFEASPGARLAFGLGRPISVARRTQPPKLRVTLRDARGEQREFQAEAPGAGLRVWADSSAPLEGLVGRVQATFALEAARPGVTEYCALSSPRIERPQVAPRTVVFVTSDTHRADYTGLADLGVSVRTPFLDALAARGVYFEDCFATTNITIPSHSAMLTGLPPRDTRLIDNTSTLADRAETLAERFRSAGYVTVAVVSTRSLGHERSGLGQGFDRASVPDDNYVDSITRVSEVQRLSAGLEDVPLFLWLHVFDAHAPYEPEPEFSAGYYEGDPYDPSLPEPENPAPWDTKARDPQFIESLYRGEITQLDSHIARALSAPRFDSAIVALTADHGESLGNHDIWYKHKGLYPDTISVPLILSWPDGPRGKRVAHGATNLDVGRTLLDLASLEHVPFPGTTLLRHLDDDAPAEPRFVIASHGAAASVELEGWHLVLNLAQHRYPDREGHQVELYHLPSDRECARDLVDAEPQRATRLRSMLLEWLGSASPEALSSATAMSAEDLADLAALGYSAGDSDGHAGVWYTPDPESPWVQRFE